MTKKRWTAAWTATLAIAIPIDAGDPETAMDAKADVELFATRLRADHPGSTVDIVRAGFGKVEAATKEITPAANDGNGLEVKGPPEEIIEKGPATITDLPAHMDRRQKAG